MDDQTDQENQYNQENQENENEENQDEGEDVVTILNKTLDKKFHQKTVATRSAKGLATLRKLLEGNTEYPPTEELWKQLIYHIVVKKEERKDIEKINMQLKHEVEQVEQYKPSLPEPILVRFYYQGEYFFIDGKNQIYQMDGSNPLVGILVGNIYNENDEKDEKGNSVYKVRLHKKEICKLTNMNVELKKIHDRDYYVDKDKNVYRGMHPQTSLIYSIGKLNKDGKIELKITAKTQSEH